MNTFRIYYSLNFINCINIEKKVGKTVRKKLKDFPF